jgi:hypothetical protein
MLVPAGTVTQTCYVTSDIETAVKRWVALGAGPFYRMDFPASIEKTYRGKPAEDSFSAAIGFLGTTLLEFLQPTNSAPSIIREILDHKGEGAVHHLYPRIRPLDAAAYDALCADYREQGFAEALFLNLPGMGRNAFYDATETLGCFLEVLEFGEPVYAAITEKLYRLHRDWDGKNPLRPISALDGD